MDPERLAAINEIFDAALDLPPRERDVLLEARCLDDAMRREVEELLDASEAATSLVDRSAGDLSGLFEAIAPDDDDPLPLRIGPFRPLRELGRGGMAVVYLAERVDGHFEQTVALKLIPAGTDHDEVVARFERERQILASLEHPSIARLLDGGIADDGRPYFAMEPVEGLPIDRHCDENRLDVEARLRLFCEVARTVDFAHRRLVLHRDLKPSNILVTPEGQIKLLDFGIATLVEPESGQQARTVGSWMTPEYASPEQVRGEAMSTASDVYQLGLLLYELLTGRRAYEFPSRAPTAVEKVICEEAPTRPSQLMRTGTRSSSGDWTAMTAAEGRRSSPPRLARRLEGDLDLVVLKCLRKEPDRRYESAEHLAVDLENHLAGRPVSAHPDSGLYRLRKFTQRHRAVLAAATLLALFGLWHVGVVLHQNRVVKAERDRAQAEAAKASAIQGFLVELFETADPQRSLGEDVTVRQVLDQGAPRIVGSFPDQPEVQAELLGTTSSIYRSLGLYEEAESYVQEALEASESLGPLARAEALARLSRLRRDQGELPAAEEAALQALEIKRRELPENHIAIGDALNAYAKTLSEQRRNEEARKLFEEALAIRRSEYGNLHDDVAATLTNLAEVALEQDRFADAETMLREALEIREAILPEDHPGLSATRGNLARVLRRLDRLEEAEVLQRKGLESHLRTLGENHPYVAIAYSNLSQLQAIMGNYEEAMETARKALSIRRRQPEPNHLMIAANLNDLGLLYRDAGDLEKAEEHLRQSIAEAPQGHAWIRVFRFNLGSVLRPQGHLQEAVSILRDVLDQDQEHYGADHTSVGADRWELGLCLAELGDLDAAENQLDEARRIFLTAYGEEHPRVARVDASRADLLRRAGRLDEADRAATSAYDRLSQRYGTANVHTARAALALATIRLAQNRDEEARSLLEEARPLLEDRDGPEAHEVREALARLADRSGT